MKPLNKPSRFNINPKMLNAFGHIRIGTQWPHVSNRLPWIVWRLRSCALSLWKRDTVVKTVKMSFPPVTTPWWPFSLERSHGYVILKDVVVCRRQGDFY